MEETKSLDYTPIGNRILVKLDEEKEEVKTKTGIILSNDVQGVKYAVIVEVSKTVQENLKPGNKIVLPNTGLQKLKVKGEDYYVVDVPYISGYYS